VAGVGAQGQALNMNSHLIITSPSERGSDAPPRRMWMRLTGSSGILASTNVWTATDARVG